MGFWQTTGRVMGQIVDVRVDKWVGFDRIRMAMGEIGKMTRTITTIDQATREETFEEAVKRLNLTDAMIEAQKRQFSILVYLFLAAAIFIFCYGTYLAYIHNWNGVILSIALTAFSLAQAFRYDFWVYQLTKKKLGCTIQEWWHSS